MCEKIPDFQPSRFYPCHSRRDNFKALRGPDVWKFCLALRLQNLWFYFGEEISNIQLCCERFFPRKFKLIF